MVNKEKEEQTQTIYKLLSSSKFLSLFVFSLNLILHISKRFDSLELGHVTFIPQILSPPSSAQSIQLVRLCCWVVVSVCST